MSDIQYLKGVGENSAKLLAKIGLHTSLDLVNNIPRRYDDYSRVLPIQKIKPGSVTIKAKIQASNNRYSKKGLHITEALASDDSGSVRIMWFNQPYRAQSIKPNEEYFISGEFAQNYKYIVITNPSIELVSNFPLNTARLVPQYKLTKGLSGNLLRKFTREAFKHVSVKETLPEWLISEKQLIDRRTALFSMHFPETLDSVVRAKKRIGFEEVFEMSLASEMNRADFARENALHIVFNEPEIVNFVSSLPFKLTNDQKKASWQILQDMTKGAPMNRLLEGDVGSGKTVVATIAALNVATSGLQVAFMAPTEILASQHAKSIAKLLPEKYSDKLCYLSGGMTKKQKENAYKNIQSGEALIIVGTHALFQEKLHFKNLGLIIIDEQHRFGVQQRKTLQSKANVMPHVLNMTATPIPRSIALTLYGEMDVSILSEKPANRQSIDTKIYQPESRPKLYESISDQLDLGRQVFVVCPQIVEDDKPGRSLSVEHIARQIKGWLKEYKVAVIHGKLKSDEKEQIMQDFLNKKSDILVSTTVIEVGVDVPNATVMVIEGADRFGLAQLHQLRGRIGRGEHKSYCYLVMTENGAFSKRLQYIEQESDGFKLAEYDLDLRGPGAIYGSMQHGALDLRVAKITDTKLIAEARVAAREFMKKGENLLQYPELKAHVEALRTITNLN